MHISLPILVAGVIQLLLLIASVYIIAFLHEKYSLHFSGTDVILLVVQACNLILFLQYTIEYKENNRLYLLLQGLFIVLLLLRFFQLFLKIQICRQVSLRPQSIREAIDYLPTGLCLYTPNGRPVLTNLKMNELIYQLTGHTVMNAKNIWEELQKLRNTDQYIELKEPWITHSHMNNDNYLLFSFSDGSIWKFQKENLTDSAPQYFQLQATEISDLYRYSKKLYENNQRLAEQYQRQKNLLANIVKINHEKEILQAKMRIHDDLGRSILTTKQHLWNHTLDENIPYLVEVWNNTIRNLSDFTGIYTKTEVSPEIELKKAADMIGCHINIHGERPTAHKTMLLFYAVVREALTNSVMHANANQLDITIQPKGQMYYIEISDNGTLPVFSLTEGGGLSNLRKRLEQEGATLQVKLLNGVVLIAELPFSYQDEFTPEVKNRG